MKIAISVSQSEKAKGPESPYFKALVEAGAKPENLELVDPADSAGMRAENFNGVLLSGGADVHPSRYGEQEKPDHNVRADPDRDKFEFGLLDRALSLRLPVMGICRGAQVVNVRFGGTLYQDLQKDWAPETDDVATVQHKQREERSQASHSVTITDPESRLAQVIQGSCRVNSTHHQGIKRAGHGLRAAAHAEDGLVEAVELAEPGPYLLAVQWHPEELVRFPEQKKLLQQFLAECRVK